VTTFSDNTPPGFKFHQYFMSSFFVRKFFCTAVMCLLFAIVIFWQKDFGAKGAHKMLVKLTPADPGTSRHRDCSQNPDDDDIEEARCVIHTRHGRF